ncbi:MAG: DUF4340 domain-containing protein [Planctomycetota bacterium]
MRLTRRNAGLLALTAALAVGVWGSTRSGDGATRRSRALVPRALEAARLTIERGAERVELVRADEGWRVASLHDFPAYADGVERFLRQLAAVRDADLAAETSARHERLGVDASGVHIRLDDGAAYVVGAVAGATYLRRADDAHVYRAPTLTVPATTSAAWIEAQPFLFDPSSAVRLSAVSGEAVLAAARGEDGRWRSRAGALLPSAPVTEWLRAVASFVATDVSLDERPGEPTLTIRVESADGALVDLVLFEGARLTDVGFERSWILGVPPATIARVQRGFEALLQAAR